MILENLVKVDDYLNIILWFKREILYFFDEVFVIVIFGNCMFGSGY